MASGSLQGSEPRSFHVIRANEQEDFDMDLDLIDPAQEGLTSSMYTLASTQSQFSNALDNWIRGAPAITAVATTNSAGVQNSSRPPLTQRSTQPGTPLTTSGIWYILAMVLPLFSLNTNPRVWGCSPSHILHAAELLTAQFGQLLAVLRRGFHSLAQDHVARDLFATAMDVLLIIYALGFLVISMYQASIFN